MASINELKEALLQTLAAKGSLGQIKARIRSEIFHSLDASGDDEANKPPLSNTNLLINELIREYLSFNQYRYSLNVFLPETNQPEVPPFDRSFLSQELHIQENHHSVQVPLLYSIIALLQQNKVGESVSSGVPIVDSPSSAAAALASSTTSTQPGQPSSNAAHSTHLQSQATHTHSHRGIPTNAVAAQANSTYQDAPRPMHFVNRS